MRSLVYIGFLLTLLSAQEISLETPESTVKSYYNAMNHADIERLQRVMVKSSFDMTMEVWALSQAFKDKTFSKILKRYGESEEVDQKVRDMVQKKLLSSSPKNISELVSTSLGATRCMVRYKENGKKKQLFTSLYKEGWKIDYKAGRKVD